VGEGDLRSIELRNFKAFRSFRLSLNEMNILVGPNNCGKSTVLGACRALAGALRHANRRKPEPVAGIPNHTLGWKIGNDLLPISVENVRYDYQDEPATARFAFATGNALTLHFPVDGGCVLAAEAKRAIRTVTDFRREFPVRVIHVPILGPVENEEVLVEKTTVQRALGTHRASRHFRNFWYHFPDGLEYFAELVAGSWPGMTIEPPKIVSYQDQRLAMFCNEHRVPRELFWAGFGFQVWCQLLTHVAQAKDATLFVLDEPETYLHPALQRQLLFMLRELRPHILLATHSTELMSDADPGEIVVIEKSHQTARRLASIEAVQETLEAIGSVQNITLTELSRHRRVVFIEGSSDFRVIRRIAKRLGHDRLAAATDVTPVELEGFSNWQRVRGAAWAIEKTLGTKLALAVICDRDYRCDAEIDEVSLELRQHVKLVHFHRRKEIENYLLVPAALQRAVQHYVQEGAKPKAIPDVEAMLAEIAEELKTHTQSRFLAGWTSHHRGQRKDITTVTEEALEAFNAVWSSLDGRLGVIPGKAALARLRTKLQSTGINLTDARIVSSMQPDEVAPDLRTLIKQLDAFSATKVE
jgi:energy-coupling factor transporter ATP-binding protein EcfA2